LKPLYFWLTLGYCALIFWLSSQTDPPQPEITFPLKDKLSHILLYGVLAAIVSLGLQRADRPHTPRRVFWWPVIFVFAFGTFDEFHQLSVPGRFFDPGDVVANTLGALMASFVLIRWYRFENRKHLTGKPTEELAHATED
jgi:VanZ family protein